jgi:glycosyltransferase involved in cell wall biosynthesis
MNARSILVLSHEFPPFGGGAGRVAAHLCAALSEKGITITVWTQKPPRKNSYPFCVRYFATGRTKQFQTSALSITIYALLVLVHGWTLRRNKPDLIFSNLAIPAGVIGSILARYLKLPHVIWHHGADVHGDRAKGAGLIFRLLLRFAWQATDLNCFVSQGLMDMALRFGAMQEKSVVLPLFADHIAPSASVLASSEKIFLFAGRLERVKNSFLLLDAVEWLLASGNLPKEVRFRIIGGGSLFTSIRKRIAQTSLSSTVSIETPRTGESMAEVYANSYAVLLTSVVEGYPLTIVEAARCGVPSIGPDTLGVNEAITHDQTGLLFSNNNPESCGRAVIALAADTARRNALGEAARQKAFGLSASRSATLLMDLIASQAPADGTCRSK